VKFAVSDATSSAPKKKILSNENINENEEIDGFSFNKSQFFSNESSYCDSFVQKSAREISMEVRISELRNMVTRVQNEKKKIQKDRDEKNLLLKSARRDLENEIKNGNKREMELQEKLIYYQNQIKNFVAESTEERKVSPSSSEELHRNIDNCASLCAIDFTDMGHLNDIESYSKTIKKLQRDLMKMSEAKSRVENDLRNKSLTLSSVLLFIEEKILIGKLNL
jgi:hypothetical protein